MIQFISLPRTCGGRVPTLIVTTAICYSAWSGELAQAQNTNELHLSDLPQAVQKNPAWLAAKSRIEEARGRLIQAGRLSNPKLEVEGRHDTAFREGSFGVAFAQAFPLTARLELEKAVSAKEVAVAEAEVRDGLRRLLYEAQTLATNYLAAKRQLVLQQQRKAIADELNSFVSAAVVAGEIPQLDEKQTRLEASRAALQIHKLRATAGRILAQLRPVLGMEPGASLKLVGDLREPFPPPEAPAAVTNRPDYQAALLAADGAESEVDLEQAKSREDITVGLFIEGERAEDAPEGLENEAFSGIKISVPLPFWNKNEGAIHEKKARATRLRGEAAALANSIRNSTATARAEMEANRALFAEISNELLPLAREQVSDLESIYRSGQGQLQAVLRAREQRIELESARLDALRDYHLARVRLEAESPSPTISTQLSNRTP